MTEVSTANVHDEEQVREKWSSGRTLFVVIIIGMIYVGRHLNRGWVSFDDGTLAQAAERVLQGQLPHRDFDDIYTGGLSMWNAQAFRIFGVQLLSLRLALFFVFIPWLAAVYYVARRVATPVRAAFVTFLAIAWSLPNYNAAMPSWYNLFLATFAVAALVRYVETSHRRWLVGAGIAAGLSILVKVVGLFLVAGVLLFLVYEEQLASQGDEKRPSGGIRAYSVFVTAGLLLFVAALCVLVRRNVGASELTNFVMPGAVLSGFLVHREWSAAPGPEKPRWTRLYRLVAPFLLGVALPVLIFLVPYVSSHSVPALLNGVFVLPMRRFGVVVRTLPPLYTMLVSAAIIAGVWASRRMTRRLRWYENTLLLILVAVFVRETGPHSALYRLVWYAARGMLPLLVLAGTWMLWRTRDADRLDPKLRRWTFLLLSCSAMCSFVQFPFAAPVYFAYVAPLVILTALLLLENVQPVTPTAPRLVLAVFLLFAMFRMNISVITRMGVDHVAYFRTVPLALERGGIRTSPTEAALYHEVVSALRMHARGGVTWAAPDTPEIYFLSGLRNPTRAISELLSSQPLDRDNVMRMLDTNHVTAVVVNMNSYYSPPLSPDVEKALEQRYPSMEAIGPFQLRWRP